MSTPVNPTDLPAIPRKTPFLLWMERNSLAVVGLLLISGFSVVMWYLMEASEDLVRSFGLAEAERQAQALAEFRTLYTSEVVAKAKENGLKITHDYHERSDAIPLPATLSMELGSRLGERNDGHATRLFSDYPFPWREEGGPKDEFETRALQELRSKPDQPYYEFMNLGGSPVLRYATADLMRKSCIDCHNTHPDTPKNDWKVGDVRGVLAVTLPLHQAVAATNGSMRSACYLMVVAGDVVLLGFAFIFLRIRRHSDILEKTNRSLREKHAELDATRESLSASNIELYSRSEDLDRARRAALNLMSDMDAARQAADSASRAKSNFLANMSHEIRTPMTAIIGFSEMLSDRETSQADRSRAVETINRNGKHLLGLINDILDLSRIEAGRMDLEVKPCRPIDLLSEVRQLLLVRAEEKLLPVQIELATPVPEVIQSDELRLRQTFVNLLGNAIKFTAQGSVRIRVEHDEPAGQLRIAVIDSGIGMDQKQVQKIFEPFSQADNSMTRRFGGTGLGLAISRELAVLLGGDLSVASQAGVGSTFTLAISTGPLDGVRMISSLDSEYRAVSGETMLDTVSSPSNENPETSSTEPTVPAVTAKPGEASPTSTQTPGKLSGRILLVEDGPDNQRLVSFLLKKRGATVDVADNGQIGLDKALAAVKDGSPYDLILMDMQMPVMDGYTAATALRETGYDGQIVALTAHALKDEIERCLQAGCDAYLRKPIEKPVFFAEIEKRLGQRSKPAAAIH